MTAVRSHPALQTLDLHRNRIGEDGIRVLCAGLDATSTLHALMSAILSLQYL